MDCRTVCKQEHWHLVPLNTNINFLDHIVNKFLHKSICLWVVTGHIDLSYTLYLEENTFQELDQTENSCHDQTKALQACHAYTQCSQQEAAQLFQLTDPGLDRQTGLVKMFRMLH